MASKPWGFATESWPAIVVNPLYEYSMTNGVGGSSTTRDVKTTWPCTLLPLLVQLGLNAPQPECNATRINKSPLRMSNILKGNEINVNDPKCGGIVRP